ncbi:Lrp/AsnC family transcriptional regulator [Massilia niastensis]|uniref:Lrp/AsnC family transcriptional regulator n=1 Tax=Massilia niastensis TaxID=544911 RepID=UPI000366F949|nr:Lrp/AsnC family transcriptional regulator [Massilia niastensis]
MASNSLDDYDKELLRLLRDNGRLLNQELSDIVGLSSSQCSRRRIALEQDGYILGYHAQLSPKGDGTPVLGLIEVGLARHSSDANDAFLRLVREEPLIRDVYKLTGSYDYLMKVAVEGLPELNGLINRLAALRDCIATLRTSVVLERIKENGVLMPAP